MDKVPMYRDKESAHNSDQGLVAYRFSYTTMDGAYVLYMFRGWASTGCGVISTGKGL